MLKIRGMARVVDLAKRSLAHQTASRSDDNSGTFNKVHYGALPYDARLDVLEQQLKGSFDGSDGGGFLSRVITRGGNLKGRAVDLAGGCGN